MPARHYWVGIDEAGYGPNLGPLAVTAIVARGSSRKPDVWADLPFVRRAADFEPGHLCVDDSKLVMARRDGLAIMQTAFSALAASFPPAGHGPASRGRVPDWSALGPNFQGGPELVRWAEPGIVPIQWADTRSAAMRRHAFVCRRWRVVAARVELIGPELFNHLLDRTGNKSEINARAFLDLIAWLKTIVPAGAQVHVTTDRHGGRHFYGALLAEAFPGRWVDKVLESPVLSRYRVDDGRNAFDIAFMVQADSSDGLAALASMVSKLMRERWMDVFNAWFVKRVPELRPTAGYPVDARRFLDQVQAVITDERIGIDSIWRRK